MSFRASAQAIVLIEISVSAAFLLLGYATGSDAEFIWLIPSIAFVHLVIFSAPMALHKGFSFVIYDAAPNSPWKYYGFIAIFVATLLGSLLDTSLFNLAMSNR